jgi:hypothetical protein
METEVNADRPNLMAVLAVLIESTRSTLTGKIMGTQLGYSPWLKQHFSLTTTVNGKLSVCNVH